jgi:hypothetical protein
MRFKIFTTNLQVSADEVNVCSEERAGIDEKRKEMKMAKIILFRRSMKWTYSR